MAQELPPLDPEAAAVLEEIPDEYILANLIDFDDMSGNRGQMSQVMEVMLDDVPDAPRVESEDVSIPDPAQDQEVRFESIVLSMLSPRCSVFTGYMAEAW